MDVVDNLSDIELRFWRSVDMGRVGDCWPWLGETNSNGYGLFYVLADRLLSHRVAYSFVNGDLHVDVVVMHSCDNPPCCNPAHLSTGTQAQNIADAISKGRRAKRAQ